MEFAVTQVGLAPLTVSEMEAVISTLDVFFQEARGEGPVRFIDIVETLRDDVGELDVTDLEWMAGCCALERRGIIRAHLLGGVLHFNESPCN